MGAGNGVDQGEAQADVAGAAAGGVQAGEGTQGVFVAIGADAWTMVAHAQPGLAVPGFQGDFQRRGAVLQGVLDQVVDQPRQGHGIGVDHDFVRGGAG